MELRIASRPLYPRCPAIAIALLTRSASVICSKYPRSSSRVCPNDFNVPSELSAENSTSPIAVAESVAPSKMPLKVFFNAVLATLPFTPELAIRPIAVATSSMLYPSAPAMEAEPANVSPIMATEVFDLEAVCARTSAKCDVSEAVSPKAVKLSVTISEVSAKSSLEAAARLSTPFIPSSISCASQPAIPMYVIACADSFAVNLVVAPRFLASADNSSISAELAPERASTVLIVPPKSMDILTQSLYASYIALSPLAMPAVTRALPASSKAEADFSPNCSASSAARCCWSDSSCVRCCKRCCSSPRALTLTPASARASPICCKRWFLSAIACSVF